MHFNFYISIYDLILVLYSLFATVMFFVSDTKRLRLEEKYKELKEKSEKEKHDDWIYRTHFSNDSNTRKVNTYYR